MVVEVSSSKVEVGVERVVLALNRERQANSAGPEFKRIQELNIVGGGGEEIIHLDVLSQVLGPHRLHKCLHSPQTQPVRVHGLERAGPAFRYRQIIMGLAQPPEIPQELITRGFSRATYIETNGCIQPPDLWQWDKLHNDGGFHFCLFILSPFQL